MNSPPGTKRPPAPAPSIPEVPRTYREGDVRPVDRFVFVNRTTLCPVCLKPCDIVTQDIVPYLPQYLPPYDTLRAYDGCYHRACLYRTGDYPRMVEAWHRGMQTLLKDAGGAPVGSAPIVAEGLDPEANHWPRVVAFERDLLAVRFAPERPLELMLFPRFARWEFRSLEVLERLESILVRFLKSPDRRHAHLKHKGLEIRPVENHEMCTLRWIVPISLQFTWEGRAGFPQHWRSPNPWLVLFKLGLPERDFGQGPPADAVTYALGDLEAELDWDLRAITGFVGPWEPVDGMMGLAAKAERLRFVPIWDDEAEAIVAFLQSHKSALQKALS